MQRKHKVLLVIASFMTTLLFVHEWIYDKPKVPYTIWETLVEFVVMGSLTTGVIFVILSGLVVIFQWISRIGRV